MSTTTGKIDFAIYVLAVLLMAAIAAAIERGGVL